MPYIENQDEEDKQQQGQDAAPPPLTIASGSPGAQPSNGAAPVAGQQSAAGAGQAPGRYTNFQRYFDANKDAATAYGNHVAGKIDGQGQGVQSDLAKQQAANANAVEAGTNVPGRATPPARTPAPAASTPAAALSAPSSRQGGGLQASTGDATPAPPPARTSTTVPTRAAPAPAPAPPAPRGLADYFGQVNAGTPATAATGAPQATGLSLPAPPDADAEDAKKLGVDLNAGKASYTGPESLGQSPGWEELLSRGRRTGDEANQTASSEGLQALLQKENAGAGYTQGQSRFDSGLVGQASAGRFSKLRDAFGGLPKQLTDANAASAAAAKAAHGQVDDYNGRLAAAQAAKTARDTAAATSRQTQGDAAAVGEPSPEQANRDKALADGLRDGPLADYHRGNWGQFDPLGAGDARQFIGNNNQFHLGLDDAALKSLYENMSDDDYREWRWIVNSGGQKAPYPGFEGLSPNRDENGNKLGFAADYEKSGYYKAQQAALKNLIAKIAARQQGNASRLGL